MKNKSVKNIYESWLNWNVSAKLTSTILNVTLWSMAALLTANYLINARQNAEHFGTQWIDLGDQLLTRAREKVNDEVKVMETLAKTPSIVDGVRAGNQDREAWTPKMIASLDKAWVDGDPSVEATLQTVAQNPISTYLIDFRTDNPEEVEVFVTDRKGLNLAMTDPTSDFLQADEDWWKSAFAGGSGSVYFGSVNYDESAKTYAMNIGIPIRDPKTNQAIGVLRGTQDISTIIKALGDLQVGTTGNIILIDSDGLVLYSRKPEHFMKPVPPSLLRLFETGPTGWKRTTDMDGHSAIVAYSSMDGGSGVSLGWRIMITQTSAETNQSVINSLLLSSLGTLLVAAFGIVVSRFFILDSIVKPLNRLTRKARELSTGTISRVGDDSSNDHLYARKDEIGDINRAFDRLMIYFESAASASTAIAHNDLTIKVDPNSDNDVLGIAFQTMIMELKKVIGLVSENAQAVSAAAVQLATASGQSGQATNQIATTIHQIALGTSQQSEDVSRTSGSMEQMSRTIDSVARGAEEQTKAMNRVSEMASQINLAIQQVTANAQSSARGAVEAADAARAGVKTVEATIASMQTIQSKSAVSAQKIREMGQRSEQIDSIVETIDEIASQTNLLALNAAIEAARVESKGENTVENILQQHMLGTVNLVTEILASGRDLNSRDLSDLAHLARVETFSITDADGVVVASNDPHSIGFRFSEDTRQESSTFRCLLTQPDGIVIRPVRERDQDSKPYIYVGVSRRDRPGIVQAGTAGDVVYRLGGYSRGFAVVSDEIRKLAEHAKNATREINVLISGIQKTVSEAMIVMEDGTRDLETGSTRAGEAGNSLATILSTAETVRLQLEEIVTAMKHMSTSSGELVKAMEIVNTVVKANTAATKDLTHRSNDVTQAIENIASVSEENSAAVEEVSAATEEVSAQVEQVSASAASLMTMAQSLQHVMAKFRLN